jgi:hypothetical protein
MESEIIETREIVDSELNMSFETYLQEIGAYGYTDEQYYHIALSNLRLRQLKELRQLLLEIKFKLNNKQMLKVEALESLRLLELEQTENISELLDLYNVEHKCELLDEHESRKALIFFKSQLVDYSSNNTNDHSINSFIIKLNIEELFLGIELKPFVEKWINYEDVYDRN